MTAAAAEIRRDDLVVYLLAAAADEHYCEKLQRHLKPIVLASDIPIQLLDDFTIPPSAVIADHKQRLFDADVVLSLVSADFIDDDDIYDRIKVVFGKYNAGQNVIVSIIVRNCLWNITPLADFPVLPANGSPISDRKVWSNEDEAITGVVRELYDSISKIARIEVVTHAETPPVTPPDVAPPVEAPATPVEPETGEQVPMLPPAAVPIDSGWDSPTQHQAVPSEPVVRAWEPPRVTAAAARTSASPAPTYRIAREATPNVEVDWREHYYSRVFWRRMIAYVLDSLLMLYVPLLLALAVAAAAGQNVDSQSEEADPVFNAAGLLIMAAFFVGGPFMESRWQGTPGKLLLGLRVTHPDGSSISFGRAIIRNLGRSVAAYWYMIIFTIFIVTFGFVLRQQVKNIVRSKHLLHDAWTKTVISKPARR